MRNLQWILLVACVAIGVLWIFIGQNWIFLNLFPGLLVGPGLKLDDYLQTGSSPAFVVFWAGCITALMIWIGVTWSSRPRSSAQTRQMQPMWWLAAILLTVFALLIQDGRTHYHTPRLVADVMRRIFGDGFARIKTHFTKGLLHLHLLLALLLALHFLFFTLFVWELPWLVFKKVFQFFTKIKN